MRLLHSAAKASARFKTHGTTRKLARRLEVGTARVLSATVTRDRAGRWQVAFQVLVQRAPQPPAQVGASPHPVVDVDAGVRDLLVVAAPDGTETARVPAPKALGSPGSAKPTRVQTAPPAIGR